MRHVVLFAALPWESASAVRSLRQVKRGTAPGYTWWQGHAGHVLVRVVRTGVGFTRAAKVASVALEEVPCDLAITMGCAGGLDPTLATGSIVIADSVICAWSGTRYAVERGAIETFRVVANAAGLQTFIGPQLCVLRALTDATEKKQARELYRALAVDMESAAVASAAAQRHIPFASIRAILDPAWVNLAVPETVLNRSTGEVRLLQLARWFVAHSPLAWRQLRTLSSGKRQVEAALNGFFSHFFGSLQAGPATTLKIAATK